MSHTAVLPPTTHTWVSRIFGRRSESGARGATKPSNTQVPTLNPDEVTRSEAKKAPETLQDAVLNDTRVLRSKMLHEDGPPATTDEETKPVALADKTAAEQSDKATASKDTETGTRTGTVDPVTSEVKRWPAALTTGLISAAAAGGGMFLYGQSNYKKKLAAVQNQQTDPTGQYAAYSNPSSQTSKTY